MKIIYPDNVLTVSADASDANFPVTNLQTDYVGEVWKGTSHIGTLTVGVSAGGGVALFGTNALSVSVAVSQYGEAVEWDAAIAWDSAAQWCQADESPTVVYDLSASSVGAMWAEYTERTGGHVLTLVLTADVGETIEAGVVQAGTVNTFVDPMYGITEGFQDYSIVRQTNSGAFYTKKRSIARTFDFTIQPVRDNDFYDFMHRVFWLLGPKPAAWRIVQNDNVYDWEWVIYAAMLSPPGGKHFSMTYSQLQIKLTEMV
jgi:hypothetical protein